MPRPPFGRPVVDFDKGGRVARLAAGARLDARQVGILFARLSSSKETGRTARLIDWDAQRAPAATARMTSLLETKGPDNKQTLLLALSMGVLHRFEVIDHDQGVRYLLEGERSAGYSVVDEVAV